MTWHPEHKPSFELDVCKAYPNEVREWDDLPGQDISRQAAVATGLCERCALSLAKVEKDEALRNGDRSVRSLHMHSKHYLLLQLEDHLSDMAVLVEQLRLLSLDVVKKGVTQHLSLPASLSGSHTAMRTIYLK